MPWAFAEGSVKRQRGIECSGPIDITIGTCTGKLLIRCGLFQLDHNQTRQMLAGMICGMLRIIRGRFLRAGVMRTPTQAAFRSHRDHECLGCLHRLQL